MSASVAVLCDALGDAWHPRPRISLADWCAANLRLPAETSASPGRYDLRRYSYCRGVLDAAENPEVERIVLEWATQLGKTTLLQALLAGVAMLQPAPAMLGTPDKDALLELRDKFYALCSESEELRDQIPPPRHRNNRWIDVGGCRCQLAYSYNTQRMSGKSCRLVIKTEIDRWRKTKTHGDPNLIIDERVKAFFRSLIVEESTPSDESSRIHARYLQSDQRRFLVPCPHCGLFQELRFFPLRKGANAGSGGVAGWRDEKGDPLPADQVASNAHYVCEACCRIESDEKPGMVEQGQHVPKGQTLDKRGKLQGKPDRGPQVWGSRLNSLYAEPVTFSKIAIKWIECKQKLDARQVFINDWLATIFRTRVKAANWRKLGVKLRGFHALHTVPQWALFLTAGADPGPGYVRWTVRAWGEGSTSALVSYGTTRSDGRKRFSQLDALIADVLDREWPLEAPNAYGDKALRVAMLGVDVGYRPRLMHDWWLSLAPDRQRRVRQIAGKAELPDDLPWRDKLVTTSRTGAAYAGGGQHRWEISRAIYSAEVHDRWRTPKEEAGAWLLPNVEPGQLELYLQEIANEAPVRRPNARGRMVTRWEKIFKSVGNHYGDCSAYELAIADMLLDRNWLDVTERIRMRRFNAGRAAEIKQKPFTRPDGRPFLVTER